jgi:hypothetical protein
MNKSKYSFTLKDLNIGNIHNKYAIVVENIDLSTFDNPNSTTKLTDLHKNTPEVVSFLDDSKQLRSCNVSMIDFTSKKKVNLLRYNCFWCRNPFDCKPIGCPLKYVSNQVFRKYHSHISKDTYKIKENVTTNRMMLLDNDKFIPMHTGEYYETDGIFCSFNCCQSFINDNKHIRLYDSSHMLLVKMYNEILNTKNAIITPAPHWRTLEYYGGTINIIQFRENFNKVEYEYHGNIKHIPNFLPLGMLYEAKIKF